MRTFALLLCLASAAAAAEPPPTMRIDYFHTGTATEEHFALGRVVLEPLPWPGNPRQPLDATNLGPYFFEVVERATNRVVYSRGFASIFGEWQTTDEAKESWRAFPESVRFPAPAGPVRVVIKKRNARQDFVEVGAFLVDPADRFIDRAAPPSPGPLIELQNNGDPADKVDLLLLGDGYTAAERGKFERDARRLMERLFAESPFKERRADFNVWGLVPAAAESGVSRPSTGLHKRSPIGSTYDIFGSERYLLTYDDRAFRDAASYAPYDFVEILANGQTYGGGGIYQLFGTVAVDSAWADYVFVHEFGHHFAALADEYYTSPVAYDTASGGALPEPWEKNVTADPTARKWAGLLSAKVPVPTPWQKAQFEEFQRGIQARRRQLRAENRPEAEMDALFREEQAHATQLLGGDVHAGKVGAFEGASYQAKGLYRPQTDCIMFTRDEVGFCAVCQRAISEVIDLYAAPPPPPSTEIFLARLERVGEAWSLGPAENLTNREGYDSQPSFRPEGDRLLYTSFRDGQTDIFERHLGTGAERQVTASAESEYSPTLTPDGRTISVVRVEGDGTQRLWRFPLEGRGEPALIAPDVPGVGYHVWLGEQLLAFFVLGDPVTLQRVPLDGGAPEVIASDIGRSLHRIPGTQKLSYVAKDGAIWSIFAYDPATRASTKLAPAPASDNRDYGWTPDGVLLAAQGAKLLRLRPGQDATWKPFADLTPAGVANITRIAVSPAGDRVALVVDR